MGPGVQPYESWVDCVCVHSFVPGVVLSVVGSVVAVASVVAAVAILARVVVLSVVGSAVAVASVVAVVAILAWVKTRCTMYQLSGRPHFDAFSSWCHERARVVVGEQSHDH